MSQHDFVIDNQNAPASRADINNALQALASCSSGTTAPVATYANMLWYDIANDLLKIRNETNSAWITLGTVDQTNNVFNPNFLPATQAEAEAGTNNIKGMTALRVAQAIAANTPTLLSAPAAGNTVIDRLTPPGQSTVVDSFSSSSSASGTKTAAYYSAIPVRTAVNAGSVRIKGSISTGGTSPTLRIYKNNVLASTITTSPFSVDITVAQGDSLHFGGSFTYSHTSSGGTTSLAVTDLTVSSSAFSIWGS